MNPNIVIFISLVGRLRSTPARRGQNLREVVSGREVTVCMRSRLRRLPAPLGTDDEQASGRVSLPADGYRDGGPWRFPARPQVQAREVG